MLDFYFSFEEFKIRKIKYKFEKKFSFFKNLKKQNTT